MATNPCVHTHTHTLAHTHTHTHTHTLVEKKSPEKSASVLLKDHKQQLKTTKQPPKRRPPPANSNGTDFESDDLFSPDCILSVDGKIENVKSSKLKTKKKPLSENPKSESDENEVERNADSDEDTANAFTEEELEGKVRARPIARRVAKEATGSGAKERKGTVKSGSSSGLPSGKHRTERVASSRKAKTICSDDENCLSGSPKKTTPLSEGSCLRQHRPDSGLQHSSNGSSVKCNEPSKPLSVKAAGHPSLRRQPSLRMLEQRGGADHTHLSPPQLGRGFKPGGVVDLSSNSKPSLAKVRRLWFAVTVCPSYDVMYKHLRGGHC